MQSVADWITTYEEEFKKTFGLDLAKFADKTLGALGIPDFDVIAFDEAMQRQGYDETKESLASYIQRVYGEDAVSLIKKLIHAR